MRTTVELDEDVTRAVQQLRRERHIGVSEAVNELVRRGLLPRQDTVPFRQATRRLGLKIDVTNVAEALDVLEGPDAR